ncbi:hypothetical protein HS041_17760 [Planomonospora sp. ID67723]|uniref:hypothetical protein n=1 Tax=Planomonospora sp. ID67723 TaxID=2738134 RepID=UPI0018C366D4|nr:hypothetical protein [Planomonospora sp. ID67723]MBG0829616.1 hypothetical protein [Planomonospora sp. ID67723]
MHEAGAVRALREGDVEGIGGWARQAVTELCTGRRRIEAVRHPLEFVCVPLHRDGLAGLCLHLWEGDEERTCPVAHAHSWDLWSYVLSGTVFNEILDVRDDATRRGRRLYRVDSLDGVDEIRPTERFVTSACERLEEVPAGRVYRLEAGRYHRSGHRGATATVVLGEHRPGAYNLVLGPPAGRSSAGRREPCPAEEVLPLLDSLARAPGLR